MRKMFLGLAVAAVAMTTMAVSSANAGVTAPAAIAPAITHTSMAQDVAWVRSCHYNRWTHRLHCQRSWTGHRHWRHRHWRHHH